MVAQDHVYNSIQSKNSDAILGFYRGEKDTKCSITLRTNYCNGMMYYAI